MERRKRGSNIYWYNAGKRAVGGLLSAQVSRLIEEDEPRFQRLQKYAALYGSQRLLGIRPWERPEDLRYVFEELGIRDGIRLNVIKSAIDTVTSKVGKLRPRPTFLTNGGQWSEQLRAQDLQVFVDGAYHQTDAYELAPEMFRDAMAFGTGALHPYPDYDTMRICLERVPVWELLVDKADALYGKPRCMYRVKWVSVESAEAIYDIEVPEADSTEQFADSFGATVREGYVRVVEAVCLPVGIAPGRRVVQVGEEVVEDSEWTSAEFPFVFIHWSKPLQGFWGDSAIAELVGLQVEVNKLLDLVRRAMTLVGQPMTFVAKDAIIEPDTVSNIPGQVFRIDLAATGGSLENAVNVKTFQPVNQQVMEHIWNLYAKAFEIIGSNQLAASATAPAGLESGRALEALSEEHSERFMTVSRHFEFAIGEALSRQFIRCAKELDEYSKAEGGKGFSMTSPRGKTRETSRRLAWDEVEIDEDGYVIQVFPESALPSTPALKREEVERLDGNGWLQPGEARRLLAFPDLKASTDLATADSDNLARQLEAMLNHGESVMPEPYQDLEKAIRTAQQAILRAQADGAPITHVNEVRNFIAAAEELLRRSALAPQSAPGGGSAEGGAAVPPEPPPSPSEAAPPPMPEPGAPPVV
jgi:hypothetical protein